MYPIERRKEILAILEKRNSASVEELSRILYVGTATIRRDLDRMAKEGIINRTHGGAVRLVSDNVETPYAMRAVENAVAKDKIAAYAAQLVKDGMAIFLDSSSTVVKLIPQLAFKKSLKIITNGVVALSELYKNGMNAVCTGGSITGSGTLTGMEAAKSIARYNADMFFFSCRGYGKNGEITESSAEVADVKELMAKNAKTRVLLVDGGKIGKSALCTLAVTPDYIITDATLNREEKTAMESTGAKILFV